MSTPTRSQMAAISLMKDTRVAKNALAAYLMIWAETGSVSITGTGSHRLTLARGWVQEYSRLMMGAYSSRIKL